MKLNKKPYFIVVSLILFLVFSFTPACRRVSTEITEAKEDIAEEEITEEIEEEEILKEAEDVEKTAEAEVPVLIKLDEIQEQYSLEFRQYLESLEKNYLENVLDDDNEIKKEYDLFEWRNIFFRDEIIFTAEKDIFPDEWYDPEIYAKAESLSEGEIERSKNIIMATLDKYPIGVLKDNLKSVYVLKSMNFFGVDYGGTYFETRVYVVNDGVDMGYSDVNIEKTFHQEFSSILLRNYEYIFDDPGWRQINPAGFEYFDEVTGGAGAIKEGKASQEFNPESHERGFLYQYAESTLENDFNSFAENIFMGDEDFFKTVEQYEKLEMKLNMIIGFYKALNPQFTIEYFKGI